jgi:hypothetical protein
VLTLLWQCERTSDIVPSTEMQTVGTLVNLRVLPSVAWVRHHALATNLWFQHPHTHTHPHTHNISSDRGYHCAGKASLGKQKHRPAPLWRATIRTMWTGATRFTLPVWPQLAALPRGLVQRTERARSAGMQDRARAAVWVRRGHAKHEHEHEEQQDHEPGQSSSISHRGASRRRLRTAGGRAYGRDEGEGDW